MIEIIIATQAFLFSIAFILLSKSKKSYHSLMKSGGEEYAKEILKKIFIGGIFLLISSITFLLFLLGSSLYRVASGCQ